MRKLSLLRSLTLIFVQCLMTSMAVGQSGKLTSKIYPGLAFYSVPVYALQLSDDDGSNTVPITTEQVKRWLDTANVVYRDAGIRFSFDGKLHPMNNTVINNVVGDEDPKWNWLTKELNDIATREHKVILAFRNKNGGGFSWWTYDFIVLPGFHKTNLCKTGMDLSLFPHELGHYFGLPHTFEITSSTEKALGDSLLAHDGNPIIFDGDKEYVNDTGPDPFVSELQCQTDIYEATIGGKTYNVLRANQMSYWKYDRAKVFTPGQIKRIRFILDERIKKGTLVVKALK